MPKNKRKSAAKSTPPCDPSVPKFLPRDEDYITKRILENADIALRMRGAKTKYRYSKGKALSPDDIPEVEADTIANDEINDHLDSVDRYDYKTGTEI